MNYKDTVCGLAKGLNELIQEGRSIRERNQVPLIDSKCIAELEMQPLFPGRGDSPKEGTVDASRATAGALLMVGEDQVRAFAELLVTSATPFVWSLPVLARAAVEAFSKCWYLTEPDIAYRVRSGRIVNYLISSDKDQGNVLKLLDLDDPEPSGLVARRVQGGERHGPGTGTRGKKGGPSIDSFEEIWPSDSQIVSRFLGGPGGDRRAGQFRTRGLRTMVGQCSRYKPGFIQWGKQAQHQGGRVRDQESRDCAITPAAQLGHIRLGFVACSSDEKLCVLARLGLFRLRPAL